MLLHSITHNGSNYNANSNANIKVLYKNKMYGKLVGIQHTD